MSAAVNYFGILVISFLLAFVVSVTVEMPFINLDQLLFENKSKALQSKLNHQSFKVKTRIKSFYYFRRKEKDLKI
jgi:hypothetical protein